MGYFVHKILIYPLEYTKTHHIYKKVHDLEWFRVGFGWNQINYFFLKTWLISTIFNFFLWNFKSEYSVLLRSSIFSFRGIGWLLDELWSIWSFLILWCTKVNILSHQRYHILHRDVTNTCVKFKVSTARYRDNSGWIWSKKCKEFSCMIFCLKTCLI